MDTDIVSKLLSSVQLQRMYIDRTGPELDSVRGPSDNVERAVKQLLSVCQHVQASLEPQPRRRLVDLLWGVVAEHLQQARQLAALAAAGSLQLAFDTCFMATLFDLCSRGDEDSNGSGSGVEAGLLLETSVSSSSSSRPWGLLLEYAEEIDREQGGDLSQGVRAAAEETATSLWQGFTAQQI